MAVQYPMNNTFKALSDASFKMGENLNKRRDNTGVDPSKYAGVAGAVKGATPSGPIPTDIASLGTVTVPYGGSTRYEPGGKHTGIDIANKIGTPIPSFVGGEVVETRTGQKSDPSKPSFGNFVSIRDQNGKIWRYSHLNEVFVEIGQQVQKGAKIGGMGVSGSVYSTSGGTGSHLDLRVFDTADKVAGFAKKYYNPINYLSSFK